MMRTIGVEKIKNFIDGETKKELTPLEEMRKSQSLKLSILEQAEEHLKRALKNNDTAMVAAIAEVLKII